MLALAGEVELELMIIEEDKKLTSNVFTLEVRKSINSEKAIVSTNEFTALLNGLASLNEYDNYKNEIKDARGGQSKLKDRLDNFDSHLEQNTTTINNNSFIIESLLNVTKPYVHNKNGINNFKKELYKLENGVANDIININVMGTSISCGGKASDYRNRGWVGLLRKTIENRFGDVGCGFIPTYQVDTGDVEIWKYTGTWTTESVVGIMCSSKMSVVSGSTATLTFKGTGITILGFANGSGGSFTATIDNTTNYEFTCYYQFVDKCKEFKIEGLQDGEHTLKITQNDNGKQVLILGAYPTKGTKGVRLNCLGRFGGQVIQAISNENVLYEGVDYWKPKLTIIEFFTNDYINQVPLDTFKIRMQTLITRAKQFGDVLLIANGIREETKTIKQIEYINILKDLVKINNIAFIDTFTRNGGNYKFANEVLGFLADTVHPNDNGHEDIHYLVSNTIL